jgi:hypothetical protein
MSGAVPTTAAAAGSTRLLADVQALSSNGRDPRTPAQIRLEAAIGRELADRLLAALASDHRG